MHDAFGMDRLVEKRMEHHRASKDLAHNEAQALAQPL